MFKPNFLFIIADQLPATHLSCYDNPILLTPNIDGLAKSGWRSQNLYVASGICMPNRASLMTGRMPSRHGVRHNGIPLSLGANTFVETLRVHGYRTIITGKSHLQNMTDQPPQWPVRAEDRAAAQAHQEAKGNYKQESPSFWDSPDQPCMDLPFYGFTDVALANGHGDRLHGHYWRWLQTHYPGIAGISGPEHALPTPECKLSTYRQAWRTRIPQELHPTAWIADKTIHYLQEQVNKTQPFFLYCSFPDPHHPFTPPGYYWDMYRPDGIELPETFYRVCRPPPHLAWLRAQRDAGHAIKSTPGVFAASEKEAREAVALSHGSTAHIDFQVGRILDTLKALGLGSNTVIIFTTDHGDFMGDHQLLWKGPLHYRSVIRSPFIWSDPLHSAQACNDSLLSTIDIAPTILERAGIPAYNGMQGYSMLPLIKNEADKIRESVLVEEEGQRIALGFANRVRMRTLITAQHRLSVYDGVEWAEIYDHQNDPWEYDNLWAQASDKTVRELMEQMIRATITLSETSPYAKNVA
ncbi:MAG: sulfatase [Candidimonas sp.]|nr:MAG: sulfatase [Candidimonas sp.]TAM20040.1 MAG: sulfatase [Candidimonas sp.]TAM77103.1 MAG: sulfatase [Candidimonas sp.]